MARIFGFFQISVVLCALSLSLWTANVFAQSSESETGDINLSFEKIYHRGSFYLGSEIMNLSGSTGASVTGIGPRGGFEYGLTDTLSIGTNLVFAFQATGKAGAFFYSGITGMLRYSYSGSALKSTSVIRKRDGTLVYTSTPATKRRSTVIFGLEQLFLNGVANIYPAVGATVGGSFAFGLFNRPMELDIRYSSLTANDNPLSMIAIGGSMNLDF